MADPYTHTFLLQFNGQTIEGEIEFNLDGKTSYKTENPIVGLELHQSQVVNNLFAHFKEVFNAFEGIVNIKVEEK